MAQSRPIACWPDGSVKWTTHTIAPATPGLYGFRLWLTFGGDGTCASS
ncbi:RIFT barrel domain-containing protein [Streptosporangium sp. G12]